MLTKRQTFKQGQFVNVLFRKVPKQLIVENAGKLAEWHSSQFRFQVTLFEKTALRQGKWAEEAEAYHKATGHWFHLPGPQAFHLFMELALVQPAPQAAVWTGREHSGKGDVRVRGQSQVRGWLPSSKDSLTMVISRRGGGLCLILGDPIKRQDIISHTCTILQIKCLKWTPGKL